jgi:hypothetical protein
MFFCGELFWHVHAYPQVEVAPRLSAKLREALGLLPQFKAFAAL